MGQKHVFVLPGTVTHVLRDTRFHVTLTQGVTVTATLSAKLRRRGIRVWLGDAVSVEVSPYDLRRGRIIERLPEASPAADRPGMPT